MSNETLEPPLNLCILECSKTLQGKLKTMARSLKRNGPPPAPRVYSRRDAGLLLGVHERSIDRLVKARELEAIELGSRVLITADSINRRLGKTRSAATAAAE
jgi:hypothetical protein